RGEHRTGRLNHSLHPLAHIYFAARRRRASTDDDQVVAPQVIEVLLYVGCQRHLVLPEERGQARQPAPPAFVPSRSATPIVGCRWCRSCIVAPLVVPVTPAWSSVPARLLYRHPDGPPQSISFDSPISGYSARNRP